MRYEDEQLTAVDHLNEYVMISLRRVEGIDLRFIEERFGRKNLNFLDDGGCVWNIRAQLE